STGSVTLLVLTLAALTIGEVEICFKTSLHYGGAQLSGKSNDNSEAILQNLEGTMTDGWILTSSPTWKLFSIVHPANIEIFNFTIANAFVNGSYDLDGYVGKNRLFDIYGKGNFMIELNNLSVAVVSSLSLNSSRLCFPMMVKVFVEDCESHFENFMNGDVDLDPLLNGVIQEIIPDAIRIIFREQVDVADPYIQSIINEIFDGKTISDLLINRGDYLNLVIK
ncbi:hypothetical protein HUJ05_012296, partial [Dendroctonus ponderosae]